MSSCRYVILFRKQRFIQTTLLPNARAGRDQFRVTYFVRTQTGSGLQLANLSAVVISCEAAIMKRLLLYKCVPGNEECVRASKPSSPARNNALFIFQPRFGGEGVMAAYWGRVQHAASLHV